MQNNFVNHELKIRPFFVVPVLLGLMLLYPDTYGKDPYRTNSAIAEFQPALAVRGSACLTCHVRIRPAYITDFGHGSRYFFGNSSEGRTLGPFEGSIYGDFYGGEPNKTAWLTAEIGKVIVPKAKIGFSLRASGTKLAGQPAYRQPLDSTSLAMYLQFLEKQKAIPAPVIERKLVFIGAPNAATLEARFRMAPGQGTALKYIKSQRSSPDINGISPGPDTNFFTNNGDIVCDGDLLVRGALFLKNATIATSNGCRIYATGPIFVQNGINYRNLSKAYDNANLQMVSAEAIILGIGDKSCDKSDKESPLSRRLVSGYAVSTFFTREADSKSISPKAAGEKIYAIGKLIQGLEDATCRDGDTGFSRLLLNAPMIHSRYTGKFSGLAIAEIALFRFGKSVFEFDPVFMRVPILPRLKESDYLQVK